MKQHYSKAIEAIQKAKKIVLACHMNPDGDTLGCILALGFALRSLGKETTLLSHDPVPGIYEWMPGTGDVLTGTKRRDFDLAIVCDAGAIDRVGVRVHPIIADIRPLIDIDHHVVADQVFGDIQILDSGAAATAELVYELIRRLGLATGQNLFSREVAQCLMTGIITDTGSFRFMNVKPHTFQIAAKLQTLGAEPAVIAELVFENRSFASLKLLGRALNALKTTPDGRIAWSHITAEDFAELEAVDAETEGIVNHVRAVTTAHIGILFREIPGKKVRISLRAREGTDANRIANVFGGGGHKLAAGCSMEPPLADVEQAILAETMRQLDEKTV